MSIPVRYLFFIVAMIFATNVYATGNPEAEGSGGNSGLESLDEGEADGAQNPAVFRVAVLRGPTSFGVIKLMEELGQLSGGVAVEYTLLASPGEVATRVVSREVEGALLPLNVAAKLYNSGRGYPLAAVPGSGSINLISRDPEIREWEDLEGKKIHVHGKGATPDILFRYLLDKNSVDIASLELDYSIPSVQLAQLAIAGQVDSLVIPQPFITMINMGAPDIEIKLDFQESWNRIHRDSTDSYPITAFVMNPEFADSNRAAAVEFLGAYRNSIEWVNSNPKEAGKLLEIRRIMKAAPAAAAIPHCALMFALAGEMRIEVEEFLRVLLEYEPSSLGGKLPDSGFYLEL